MNLFFDSQLDDAKRREELYRRSVFVYSPSPSGAPNVDSAATGTTLRDYIRAADFTHIPEEAVALYFDGSEDAFVPSPSIARSGLKEPVSRGRS